LPLEGGKDWVMADVLVVQSKVRDQVKRAKLRLSSDAVDALSKAVSDLINKAGARAKANKRQTIKASDI
jgi:histone H3/H4